MNDSYNQFNALDFAQEDSFIKWVRKSDEAATVFWEQWLKEHPEKANDVATARQLVQSIRLEAAVENPQQVDRMWNKIESAVKEETSQQVHPKPRSISRWLGYVAAAASVVLVLFFFFPKGEQSKELLAQNGEIKAYYLPDSSMVKLNAGSRLVVNTEKWLEERIVELEGEAFFKVRKGSRFVVQTANGMVEVLGTSFNVNARAGELIVDCFTGKVKVSKPSIATAQILTPLEGVRLAAGKETWEKYKVNPSRQATWRDGMFYFDQTPLVKVFAELERQFNIQIEADNQHYMRAYSGFFDRRDIDKALNSVCYPMSLTYEKENDVVIIKSGSK